MPGGSGMRRRYRFTERSSLKDRLLRVFVTFVAPIVEEHDIGLCRVTGVLNAIYVAETGYVWPRVRIFVFASWIRCYATCSLRCQWRKKTIRRTRAARYSQLSVFSSLPSSPLSPLHLFTFYFQLNTRNGSQKYLNTYGSFLRLCYACYAKHFEIWLVS